MVSRSLNMLIRTCGWCGEHMGTKPGPDGETHGICAKCFAIEIQKAKAA